MTAKFQNGAYPARAVPGSWELGESKSGTEYIQVVFQMEGGPYDGQTIAWRGFFTDRTAERTVESLRHCGWQGNDIDRIDALPNAVEIVIEEEEYDGKVYSRVQWVNRLAGGPALANPLDTGKRKTLAARLKGLCAAKAVQPVEQAPPRSAMREPAPTTNDGYGDGGFNDDDIPF